MDGAHDPGMKMGWDNTGFFVGHHRGDQRRIGSQGLHGVSERLLKRVPGLGHATPKHDLLHIVGHQQQIDGPAEKARGMIDDGNSLRMAAGRKTEYFLRRGWPARMRADVFPGGGRRNRWSGRNCFQTARRPTDASRSRGIHRNVADFSGHAVRAPVLNASLTDCVFELQRPTTAGEVNELFKTAAKGPLAGILGFEARPLVSIDYQRDTRSSIVDGPSTLVTDGTLLKVYAWYDNEMGYACRMVDLACHLETVGI